jgi:hypothetical protein
VLCCLARREHTSTREHERAHTSFLACVCRCSSCISMHQPAPALNFKFEYGHTLPVFVFVVSGQLGGGGGGGGSALRRALHRHQWFICTPCRCPREVSNAVSSQVRCWCPQVHLMVWCGSLQCPPPRCTCQPPRCTHPAATRSAL